MRTWPQVSVSPVLLIAMPVALTVELPPVVLAAACGGCGIPHGACAATPVPVTQTGLPFTRTEATPLVAAPPAEFESPFRCTAGIVVRSYVLYLSHKKRQVTLMQCWWLIEGTDQQMPCLWLRKL